MVLALEGFFGDIGLLDAHLVALKPLCVVVYKCRGALASLHTEEALHLRD
jgi:hypothetical protein